MIAAWAIFGAFIFQQEWISTWLRSMTHSIDALAGQVP
jgi:hypothetical protein